MSVIVVIPARYSSTRFPGKPLALLRGEPIIQHVYRNCAKSLTADDVVVATDSNTIFETVLSFKGKAIMTSSSHISGTDRIAEAVRETDYDTIVNVQGDEPLIRPEMIDTVVSALEDRNASIGTLAKEITDMSEVFDPNVVKVVFDQEGFALYFSRSPIPYHRELFTGSGNKSIKENISPLNNLFSSAPPSYPASALLMFKHIGIYSYKREALFRLTSLPPSRLEMREKLEQLRALENNFRIKVKETSFETVGVDTPEDLERIEKCLNSSL